MENHYWFIKNPLQNYINFASMALILVVMKLLGVLIKNKNVIVRVAGHI